jgi:tetratricopeptide (TPR) repeat protein
MMALDSKPPDFYELVKKWVFEHFGIPGLLGLAVLAAAFWVYKNWDKVKTWPGIASILAYLRRRWVPKADPNRFSVMVAHLEKDAQMEHERLIVAALEEFEGVQTLRLDRTIRLEGPVPEAAEKRGQKKAQRYLQISGASVLIWGIVLKRGDRTVYKLYWTPAAGGERKPERYAAPLAEAQLRLPEVFWGDLAEILRLQITSAAAEFAAQEGRYLADRLPPFIARVKKLLEASAGRPGWDADAKGRTLGILAYALYTLGEQSGQNKPLEEAVTALQEALKELTRERVPLDWAGTQNNLGIALRILGERESGTARLEEAVKAYQESLKERTRERAPQDWAMTQNSLGNALLRLGERESGTARLEEAVKAFQEALKEFSREWVPRDWAMTQNNLGNALLRLGERESGTVLLEEAVTTYREALKEQSRERVPLDWAMTQNNLGLALQSLGEREIGTARLEEAVKAYQEALKERTRERVPRDWAMTQNNLGTALAILGERESGTERLEEAVKAYLKALKERTRERVPLQWALTQNNLGNAFLRLGERESGMQRLEDAVKSYQAALEVFEPSQASYYVEGTKANLQNAEALLRERRR